jgi:hypothetical protein
MQAIFPSDCKDKKLAVFLVHLQRRQDHLAPSFIPDDETYFDSRHDGRDGRHCGMYVGREGYTLPG